MRILQSSKRLADQKGKLGIVCSSHVFTGGEEKALKVLSNLVHNRTKAVENESRKILIMNLKKKIIRHCISTSKKCELNIFRCFPFLKDYFSQTSSGSSLAYIFRLDLRIAGCKLWAYDSYVGQIR